ncbi:MAG: hypothetical protein GY769_19480 [bacterium]|nr:hypothetical protein [bacterium]
MKRHIVFSFGLALLAAGLLGSTVTLAQNSEGTENAEEIRAPEIHSMSALAFGPEGVLFIGDSKAGAVLAIDVGDSEPGEVKDGLSIKDIETKIGAALGTTADQVMIHDLAVHPVSRKVYLAVSRGRGKWDSRWLLPNDIADASILLRIENDGSIREVSLLGVEYTRAALANPVDAAKTHMWKKGISLRADTITDMAYADETLFVAGLSNEEFASTMWRIPFPFAGESAATTLEIFHGAHGAFETHAPIRTFVPYRLKGESHVLASYLCTPFVTFKVSDLEPGKHVKGRTIAEFGSGNYPLDMVVYQKSGEDRLLIANSNLPLMVVDPKSIEEFEGEILEEPDTYLAGLSYEPHSGTGIQQLDLLSPDFFVALQRLPGGTLDLVTLQTRHF